MVRDRSRMSTSATVRATLFEPAPLERVLARRENRLEGAVRVEQAHVGLRNPKLLGVHVPLILRRLPRAPTMGDVQDVPGGRFAADSVEETIRPGPLLPVGCSGGPTDGRADARLTRPAI